MDNKDPNSESSPNWICRACAKARNGVKASKLSSLLRLARFAYVARDALLVYANREHLYGPLAESESGYLKGRKVILFREIGQTAKEALRAFPSEDKGGL